MIDKRTAFGNYQEFKDKKSNIKAVLENDKFVSRESLQTIRFLDCKILTLNENERCDLCQSCRSTLNTLSWSVTKTSIDSSSQFHPKTSNQQMSREQLKSEVTILHKEVRTLRTSLSKMKNFVMAVVEQEVEREPEELHDICSKICSDEEDIIKEFKSDSPQYLLWKQQKKQLT